MTCPLQEVHLQLQLYYFSKNWTQCCTAIITYQSFADRTGILYHITPNLYIHVKNMKFSCNVHGINSVLVSVSLCNTSRKVEWNWTTRARSTWDCGEATEVFACIWLLVSLGLYGIFRHWTDDTNKSLDIHLMCLFTCSAIVQQNLYDTIFHPLLSIIIIMPILELFVMLNFYGGKMAPPADRSMCLPVLTVFDYRVPSSGIHWKCTIITTFHMKKVVKITGWNKL